MPVNCSHVVLDACCALNFSASGYFVQILQSLPAQVVVTQVVKDRELLSLRRLTDELPPLPGKMSPLSIANSGA